VDVGAKHFTFDFFLPIRVVKMDILQTYPDIQARWAQVPEPLQMDVLDILRSDLSEADKTAAVDAATTVTTQGAFIPYNPLLAKARADAEDATEALLYKPEVSKLNFVCVFCKSKNTIVVSRQTRSADEATPVRIICLDCSKTSVERG